MNNGYLKAYQPDRVYCEDVDMLHNFGAYMAESCPENFTQEQWRKAYNFMASVVTEGLQEGWSDAVVRMDAWLEQSGDETPVRRLKAARREMARRFGLDWSTRDSKVYFWPNHNNGRNYPEVCALQHWHEHADLLGDPFKCGFVFVETVGASGQPYLNYVPFSKQQLADFHTIMNGGETSEQRREREQKEAEAMQDDVEAAEGLFTFYQITLGDAEKRARKDKTHLTLFVPNRPSYIAAVRALGSNHKQVMGRGGKKQVGSISIRALV